MRILIPSSTGTAFKLKKNQVLNVVDIEGQQVSDLFCVSSADSKEVLSCARSLDYNDGLFLTAGHFLYSNRSNVMLEILKDSCGRHDLLMPPCSLKMFQIVADDPELQHPSCHENLLKSLEPFGLNADDISNTFNIFMNVHVADNGTLKIEKPLSRSGDAISFLAHMDLIVALTACSHEQSNAGKLKQVAYEIR